MGYSRAKTLQQYGDRIRAAMEQTYRELAPISDPFRCDPDLCLDFFENVDPTPKNAYVLAMVRWFVERQMRFPEDASKVIPTIHLLMRFRQRYHGRQPMRMTFEEFLDLADENDVKSRLEIKQDYVDSLYRTAAAIHYFEDDDILIVVPKTWEAAKYFGRHTRWCTSGNTPGVFEDYNEAGNLFIVLFKKENRRWQFHFERSQFMDERDETIPFAALRPIMAKYFEYQIIENLADRPNLCRLLENPTNEQINAALSNDGMFLKHVENPSREQIELAFKIGKAGLNALDNPSEDVINLALDSYSHALADIDNPTEEQQRRAVTRFIRAIRYVKWPSRELQRIAIGHSPYAALLFSAQIDPKVKLDLMGSNPEVVALFSLPDPLRLGRFVLEEQKMSLSPQTAPSGLSATVRRIMARQGIPID